MKERPDRPIKRHPLFGACGLDCGLCPRFHSGGEKPCPGCCGEGFWELHPSCPHITCCVKQRGLKVCGECNELEFCPRVLRNLEAAKNRDSVISYQTLPSNLSFIQQKGLKAAVRRQQGKVDFLRLLIADYNDGRAKGFYCLCVQLLPLEDLKLSLEEAQKGMTPGMALKARSKLVRGQFDELAKNKQVVLKLRTGKAAPA
jgi:hypothetical protein